MSEISVVQFFHPLHEKKLIQKNDKFLTKVLLRTSNSISHGNNNLPLSPESSQEPPKRGSKKLKHVLQKLVMNDIRIQSGEGDGKKSAVDKFFSSRSIIRNSRSGPGATHSGKEKSHKVRV